MTDDIWSPSTAARGTAKEGSPHSTWFTVYLYGFGCSVFCFSTLNFSKVVNIVHSLEFRLPPRKLSWKKKAGQWFSSIENVGRLSESGRCYSCNKEGASFCPHLLCDDLKLQMTFGCDTWLRYTACEWSARAVLCDLGVVSLTSADRQGCYLLGDVCFG